MNQLETQSVEITSQLTTNRHRRVNQYIRSRKVGKGQHGEVFLCTDESNHGRQVALKIVKRSNPRDRIKLLRRNHQQNPGGLPPLSSTEHSVRKEITVMKKCRHGNIVRLFEVIDDPQQDKIFLAMEFLAGGPIQWSNTQHQPVLSIQQTRRIIRDVILGLEYLHHEGIIHRDIKPANLLWTHDRTIVKIIDFGISHFIPPITSTKSHMEGDSYPDLFPESDLLRRIGTPSFLAPEIVWFSDDRKRTCPTTSCDTLTSNTLTIHDGITVMPLQRPPITKAIDIWSLAVTFYCLLFGHTPFSVPASANENAYHNEFVLYNQICTQDWFVDETMGADRMTTGGRHPKDPTSDGFIIVDLLDRMLRKNPRDRATIPELKVSDDIYLFGPSNLHLLCQRNPWILRDIANPKEWLHRTSPTANEITICRWMKKASKRFSDLLSTHRVRAY
ncbi:kinase-like domain-containing protein [Collybia nuda]|uniref:Kinase-like domain-containing protein n=1 Tax=Collybia nuda TaxID=64659 RepID=A0A9P6CK56_9AGAR|nr:kinase-like domain-containing protein [Collybia nuda]